MIDIRENTDKWLVQECGYGVEIVRKRDWETVWLQGDDSDRYLAELKAIGASHTDKESVWYNKTWNHCIACISNDYFNS
jgi:hypothetical protein